jgi:hypothetical protein
MSSVGWKTPQLLVTHLRTTPYVLACDAASHVLAHALRNAMCFSHEYSNISAPQGGPLRLQEAATRREVLSIYGGGDTAADAPPTVACMSGCVGQLAIGWL